MSGSTGIPTLVWATGALMPLVREVSSRVGLRIVTVGSPRAGEAGVLAEDVGAVAADDVRTALKGTEASFVWLVAPGDFGADPAVDDAGILESCAGRGVRVASVEPIPATALMLAGRSWSGTAESMGTAPAWWPSFCPLLRWSRQMREAAELLDQFGGIDTVAVECWGTGSHGSLGARLFDAMDAVQGLLGEPDRVDAVYVSPARAGGVHMLPEETLRGLHGEITANMRFSDGRAASLVASDRAGRWNRSLTLIGAGGRLRVYEDGFEWIGPEGDRIDVSRDARRTREAPVTTDGYAEAVSEQLGRVLEPGASVATRPINYAAVLSMAGAALLSARTGESESPATILRMAGVR